VCDILTIEFVFLGYSDHVIIFCLD